jgi:hypothetical protein
MNDAKLELTIEQLIAACELGNAGINETFAKIKATINAAPLDAQAGLYVDLENTLIRLANLATTRQNPAHWYD